MSKEEEYKCKSFIRKGCAWQQYLLHEYALEHPDTNIWLKYFGPMGKLIIDTRARNLQLQANLCTKCPHKKRVY